jgi:hypothetical protein
MVESFVIEMVLMKTYFLQDAKFELHCTCSSIVNKSKLLKIHQNMVPTKHFINFLVVVLVGIEHKRYFL